MGTGVNGPKEFGHPKWKQILENKTIWKDVVLNGVVLEHKWKVPKRKKAIMFLKNKRSIIL